MWIIMFTITQYVCVAEKECQAPAKGRNVPVLRHHLRFTWAVLVRQVLTENTNRVG